MQNKYNTRRLQLTGLGLNDAEFIFELLNTAGWIQYIGDRNIKNIEDAKSYIQRIIDNPDANYWVVNTKEENTPIGIVTLIKRTYLEHSDIGFSFLEKYSRQGYASEATDAVLKDLFNSGEHQEILAITIKENRQSIKLLEKTGFCFQKEILNDNEMLQVYKLTSDSQEINQLIRNFFSIFDNAKNHEPEWDELHEVCIPQTIIIKKSGESEIIYNLETFLTPRKIMLSSGALNEFQEYETSQETTISGHIAQRFSRYQKEGFLNGIRFCQQGIKLFQFIKTSAGWKINSLIWEDK